MANAFDQFDQGASAPSSNVFDQFDSPNEYSDIPVPQVVKKKIQSSGVEKDPDFLDFLTGAPRKGYQQSPLAETARKGVGAAEAGLTALTGTASYIPAVVGGALNSMNEITQGRRPNMDRDTADLINALTYEPRTDKGEEYTRKYLSPIAESIPALGALAPGLGRPSLHRGVPRELAKWPNLNPKAATKFDKLDEITPAPVEPAPNVFDQFDSHVDLYNQRVAEQEAAKLAIYKQHADELQRTAQDAEIAKGQQPIAVSPEGVAGTPGEMEGLRQSTEGITYENVPPDAVIPRSKPDGSLEVPKGNTWIPDENGMPVRQGLPEEPLAKPEQSIDVNQPHVNDLGNAIQEANGPKLGADDTYGSSPLSGPMGAPELPSPLQPYVSQSSRFGGGQRGSVNIPEFTNAVRKVVDSINALGNKFSLTGRTSKEDYLTKNIPGMQKSLADRITPSDAPEKIIADSVKTPDIPDPSMLPWKGGVMPNVQSGLIQSSSKFQNHPLLLGVGRILNETTKIAENRIRSIVRPLHEQFMGMKGEDVNDFAKLVLREMFDEKRYTSDQLVHAGFSDKTVTGYQMYRASMDGIYEMSNKGRTALGKEPITKGNAYLASMRQGDWQFAVNDKAGKPVWFVRTFSKAEGHVALDYLQKNFGDQLNFNKIKPEFRKTGSQYNPNVPRDVMGEYQALIRSVADNKQLSEVVRAGLNKYLEQKGYGVLGHNTHFLDKNNLRGFEGDKPWLSKSENANALVKAQLDYMHNALHWNAFQDGMAKLKPIMENPELLDKSPNAVNLVTQVVNAQYGANTNVLAGLEKGLAQMLPSWHGWNPTTMRVGRSSSTIYEAVSGVKGALYLQTLGINMAHFIATITQPFTNAPAQHAVLTAEGIKHNIAKTGILAMSDFVAAMARHEAHSLIGKDVNIPMTKIGEHALQYYEDNGGITKNIYNESTNVGGNIIGRVAKGITSPTISLPEKMARLSTFMSFVHHLEDSGKFTEFKPNGERDYLNLFRKAEEMTDNSLGSYRPADRPLVVNKLGATGNLTYTFKNYLFSEFNQLSQFTRLAKEGKPAPLLTHLGMLAAVGGVLSVPTLNEVDGLWNDFKDGIAEYKPAWYHYVKGNGLKASLIEHLPDWLSYGTVSAALGAALQTKYGTDVVDPEHPGKNLLPMWQDIKETKSIAAWAANPNSTTATEAVYQQMPQAIKGNMENHMKIFQGPKPEDPNVPPTQINPNNLEDSRAMDYRRTESDKNYRTLGMTSLPEVKAKQTGYINAQESERIKTATDRLSKKIFSAIRRGDTGENSDAQYFGQSYLKINPDNNGSDHLQSAIEKMIDASSYTPSERAAMKATTVQELQNVKRLMNTRGQ